MIHCQELLIFICANTDLEEGSTLELTVSILPSKVSLRFSVTCERPFSLCFPFTIESKRHVSDLFLNTSNPVISKIFGYNNNVVGSLQVVNTTLDTVEPSFPVDNTNTPNDTSKDPLPVANNITINSIEATVQAVIEAPVQAVTTNSHY